MPGRFVPVLGVGSCLLLLTQQAAGVWLGGAIALVVGVLLYFGAKPVLGSSTGR